MLDIETIIIDTRGEQRLQSIVQVVDIAINAGRAEVNSRGTIQFDPAAERLYSMFYVKCEELRAQHPEVYPKLSKTLLKLFYIQPDK